MPIIDEAFLATLPREPLGIEASQEQDDAFKKAVKLIASRERCSHELTERLVRDGFAACDAAAAVERACSCGMVDDERYADILVRSRLSQGKGRAGIEDELSRLHIDADRLPGWPDDYFPADGSSEEQRAYEFLCRKPPRAKNVYAAACRKLVSRGFSADVAFSVARRYAEGRDF